MMFFGLLVIIIFNFAFEPSGTERALIAPGILWVAFAFAGILGLNRSLAVETDNDCLQGLLLAPLSRGDLYTAKVLSNLAFMMFAELIILPIFAVFYNLHFGVQLLWILLIATLGTIGFVAVGTILSTISANTRMKEVMLPILQIPLCVPVVIAAVEATTLVLAESGAGISLWMNLLVGFDIIFSVVSYLIFEYVVEE